MDTFPCQVTEPLEKSACQEAEVWVLLDPGLWDDHPEPLYEQQHLLSLATRRDIIIITIGAEPIGMRGAVTSDI